MLNIRQSIQKILMEEFTIPKDAFLEIESELRSNARSMGIDYNNTITVNTNRVLSSPKDIGDWSQKKKQWAGYGSTWIDWVARNMPHWLASKFYVVTVNSLDIISVNSKQSKQEFEKQYIRNIDSPKDMAINFEKIHSDGKGGVAFRPYNKAWGNHDWYNSIDIDSIVIVNNKSIKSIKLLLDASELIADYKDRNNY